LDLKYKKFKEILDKVKGFKEKLALKKTTDLTKELKTLNLKPLFIK
jgi:hypothetical protein